MIIERTVCDFCKENVTERERRSLTVDSVRDCQNPLFEALPENLNSTSNNYQRVKFHAKDICRNCNSKLLDSLANTIKEITIQ